MLSMIERITSRKSSRVLSWSTTSAPFIFGWTANQKIRMMTNTVVEPSWRDLDT